MGHSSAAYASHVVYEPAAPTPCLHLGDRVSVADRAGAVIGFYRGVETVLVHFDSGESVEYAQEDLATA